VGRVAEGFLPLGRERELRVRQAILLGGAQALRTRRDVRPVRALALHLASLLDVAARGLFLLLGCHGRILRQGVAVGEPLG
jgi:hypothetical protein